jgi:2,4-dienoyl-CoA reductase-like NADH-dependent reductase (Old Yellow Enzyme family)
MRSLSMEVARGVRFSEDVSVLNKQVRLGDFSVPNRIAIQPLEAADAGINGAPTCFTRNRYIDYAKGCAGIIWFEACSLDFPEARSHDSMLVISEDTLLAFKRIVEEVKKVSRQNQNELGIEDRAFLVLQLSHAGRYRVEKSKRSPAMAYRFPEVDKAFGINDDVGRVMPDVELEELIDAYVRASILAFEAGFDAVDVKACHGYLLNDLLAGFTRDGEFGGKDFEKRSRYIIDTIKTIISETDGMVTSRLNAYDGFPPPFGFGSSREVRTSYGLASFDPSEPARLIRKMADVGVSLINISLGNPYYSQFLTRPFDKKMPGQKDSPFHPIKGVEKHFKIVESLKKLAPKMLFLGSGYSWLRQYGVNAAAYNIKNSRVDIAGWGRLALAYPSFPKEVLYSGKLSAEKVCVTCSSCSRLLRMRLRAGCVLQNPDIFMESLKMLNHLEK